MSDTHVFHGRNMLVVLAYLCICHLYTFDAVDVDGIVLLCFLPIDRMFLCSLVQVESNMQICAEMGVRLTRLI